jgi:tetratricopeptide (TPR) repeat protein
MVHTAKRHRQEGKPDLALEIANRALSIGFKRWGQSPDAHPNLMWVWLEIGASQSSLGMMDESNDSFQNARALAEQTLGADHPQMAYIFEHQGVNLMRQGAFEKAYEKFKSGLELLLTHVIEAVDDDGTRSRGRMSAETRSLQREELDSLFHNMIAALYQSGKYKECDSHYRDYFARFESSFGEDLETARFQNNWGLVLQQIGRLDDAENLFVESIRIRETVLGLDHPALIGSLSNLAQFSIHYRNDFPKAETYFRKALNIAQSALPPSHPTILQEVLNMSLFLRKQGRSQEAIAQLRTALTKARPTNENFQLTILCSFELAALLLQTGELTESESLFSGVVEQLLNVPNVGTTPLSTTLLAALNSLADLFAQQGQVARAVEARNLIKKITSPIEQ